MDLVPYLKTILGLIFVIGLIFIILPFLKRINNIGFLKANKNKRLLIEDILYIDSKRKILLLKRDEVEHLLFIGETDQFIIETIKNV